MLQGLMKLLAGVTPEQAVAKGAQCVDHMLAKSRDKEETVQHLFRIADDSFSETKYEEQYDLGIIARLEELGHTREILLATPVKKVEVHLQVTNAINHVAIPGLAV